MSLTGENVTFEGTVPNGEYNFATNYDGYDGLNFVDLIFMTKGYLDTQKRFGDTGYQSAMHGHTEAYTQSIDNTYDGYGFGYMYAPSGETFNLKNGVFASVWETNQPVQFISYTLQSGLLVKKAEVTIDLNQTATKVNFANYGSDFKNISGFALFSTRGSAGAYSHYYHNVTYGYEIVMDNIHVTWHGGIPRHYVHHAVAAPLHGPGEGQPAHASSGSSAVVDEHGYHSQLIGLAALTGHDAGESLTGRFLLPHAEHFGT